MKVAVVTGASSGIGLATAEVFREHGWMVYSISRGVPVAPSGHHINHLPFDLTKTGDLLALLSDVPQIDALVHNAGITEPGPVMEVGPVALYRLLDACDGRLKASRGALVSVSSYAAGIPRYGVYGEAKKHIEELTLRYGADNAAHGVRANIVRPHYITETRNWPVPAEPTRLTIPLGRFGFPREVATLIYELAVNEFVTGAVVPADGGVSLSERKPS